MAMLCSAFTNNIIFNENKNNAGHLRFMCETLGKLCNRHNKNIIRPKLPSNDKSHIIYQGVKGCFINKMTTAAII